LEKILKGENTFEYLIATYNSDPANVELAVELSKKYFNMRKREAGLAILQKVVDEHAREARFTTIPYYMDKQVNALEYAKYMLVSNVFMTNDPAPMMAFLKEYPDGDFTQNGYFMLGNYYMYQGDADEGEEFFEEAIEKYPDNARMLTEYIWFCANKKRNLEIAEEMADKVIGMTQVVFNDPYNNRAMVLAAAEDSAQLKEQYGEKHLENRAAAFARELAQYSSFWISRKENEASALKAAEIALKLNPGSASRRYSLALSYARTGNMEKANEIFGRDFIEKHLDDATAVRLYTMFWTQQGENLDHVL